MNSRCCGSCFCFLAKQDPILCQVWEEICNSSPGVSLFEVDENVENPNLPEYKVAYKQLLDLEKNGYLISTDSNQKILIKLIGEKDDGDGWKYYCPRKCSDENL